MEYLDEKKLARAREIEQESEEAERQRLLAKQALAEELQQESEEAERQRLLAKQALSEELQRQHEEFLAAKRFDAEQFEESHGHRL